MANLEPIVLSCSPEDASLYRLQRKITDGDFDFHGMLPDSDLSEEIYLISQNVREAEEAVIKGDYWLGSATKDDDILSVKGSDKVLLTAEHATWHLTRKKDGSLSPKEPDVGTAGLAYSVATNTKNNALIANGRQTTSHREAKHPFKDAMHQEILLPGNVGHFAIHAMASGLAFRLEDHRGYSVFIGIGDAPTEATNTLVYDYLAPSAGEMGLKVGVNQPFIAFNRETDMPILNEDGSGNTKVFKGTPAGSIAYSQVVAEESGKRDSYVAIQFELSSIIRYRPNMSVIWPDRRNREFGQYLGYHFMQLAVESIDKL